ncbi:hypothetical protein VTL71DRAFT_11894 [Oculimacula yallundae]|uniref:Uncharacterized protein n=1 Tax=Oculimacula yallundae TaxID=86028 RepID=A0ABR4CRE6_9HELO
MALLSISGRGPQLDIPWLEHPFPWLLWVPIDFEYKKLNTKETERLPIWQSKHTSFVGLTLRTHIFSLKSYYYWNEFYFGFQAAPALLNNVPSASGNREFPHSGTQPNVEGTSSPILLSISTILTTIYTNTVVTSRLKVLAHTETTQLPPVCSSVPGHRTARSGIKMPKRPNVKPQNMPKKLPVSAPRNAAQQLAYNAVAGPGSGSSRQLPGSTLEQDFIGARDILLQAATVLDLKTSGVFDQRARTAMQSTLTVAGNMQSSFGNSTHASASTLSFTSIQTTSESQIQAGSQQQSFAATLSSSAQCAFKPISQSTHETQGSASSIVGTSSFSNSISSGYRSPKSTAPNMNRKKIHRGRGGQHAAKRAVKNAIYNTNREADMAARKAKRQQQSQKPDAAPEALSRHVNEPVVRLAGSFRELDDAYDELTNTGTSSAHHDHNSASRSSAAEYKSSEGDDARAIDTSMHKETLAMGKGKERASSSTN